MRPNTKSKILKHNCNIFRTVSSQKEAAATTTIEKGLVSERSNRSMSHFYFFCLQRLPRNYQEAKLSEELRGCARAVYREARPGFKVLINAHGPLKVVIQNSCSLNRTVPEVCTHPPSVFVVNIEDVCVRMCLWTRFLSTFTPSNTLSLFISLNFLSFSDEPEPFSGVGALCFGPRVVPCCFP